MLRVLSLISAAAATVVSGQVVVAPTLVPVIVVSPQTPLPQLSTSNRASIAFYTSSLCAQNQQLPPSVLQLGSGICQDQGTQSSLLVTCGPNNNGGTVNFCQNATCSTNCRTVTFLNGQCFATSPLLGSVPTQAQSFSATCGAVAAVTPVAAAPPSASQGPIPSTLPSTSSTNGAESASTIMYTTAGLVSALITGALML